MIDQILVIFEALPQAQTGAEVPEWFRVVPLGEDMPLLDNVFPSFSAGPQDFEAMIRAFKARKYDMVIDYEHQTLKGVQAPAAGWVRDLETRPDGLWAKAEWTPKAQGYLQNREYRYFSPVLLLNRETQRPFDIRSVALTNTPSIIGLEPLVAKTGAGDDAKAAQEARARQYGIGVKADGKVTKPGEWAQVPDEQWADPVNYRYPMPDKSHCQNALSRWGDESNRAQYTPAERNIMENRMKRRAKALGIQTFDEPRRMAMKGKLIALLKMKAEATDEEVLAQATQTLALAGALPEICQVLALKAEATPGEVLAALKAQAGFAKDLPLIAQAVGLDGNVSPTLIIGRIAAFKATAEGAEASRQELLALKAEQAKERAEGMVAEALRTGRTSPEELDRDNGVIRTLALKDQEMFKTLILSRQVGSVVPVDKIPKQPGDKKGAGGLDADDTLICKALGVDAEKYKAEQQRQAGLDQ